jgi:hypothetical protein
MTTRMLAGATLFATMFLFASCMMSVDDPETVGPEVDAQHEELDLGEDTGPGYNAAACRSNPRRCCETEGKRCLMWVSGCEVCP